MSQMNRAVFALVISSVAASATARAQSATPPPLYVPPQPQPYVRPLDPPPPMEDADAPRRGDFDAGGQLRLPSGPDEMGKFATFNWVAVDLKGRYYLLPWLTVTGNLPLAVKKPDTLMTGEDPRLIGGFTARLEAKLSSHPSKTSDTGLGFLFTAGYLREGALLLSEKDYPLFTGSFKPGLTTGLSIKLKLSSLIDFSTVPVVAYQAAEVGSSTAVQLPLALILQLGSLLKVSADLGIFTGDDYSFSGAKGGRISTGGALTVKLGPIIAHAGAGFASLLTGGMYPTVRDSVYIDLDVKYAK